jgi:hypothetical protein
MNATWRLHRADACAWAQAQLDDPLGVGGKVMGQFMGRKMVPGLAEEMAHFAENLLVALRSDVLMLVRIQCTLHPETNMAKLRAHGSQRR